MPVPEEVQQEFEAALDEEMQQWIAELEKELGNAKGQA